MFKFKQASKTFKSIFEEKVTVHGLNFTYNYLVYITLNGRNSYHHVSKVFHYWAAFLWVSDIVIF